MKDWGCGLREVNMQYDHEMEGANHAEAQKVCSTQQTARSLNPYTGRLLYVRQGTLHQHCALLIGEVQLCLLAFI